jgi:hypothetical protein
MPTDIEIYCGYMAGVRTRIGIVQAVLAGTITTGIEGCNTELVFLQFRKTLELMAFASLAAHKAEYSAVHANFAKHWRAKAMLAALEKVNPDFYPVALDPFEVLPSGVKHFPRPTDGFLTKADFISLYDASSEVLHSRNPFTEKDPTIAIGYGLPEWVARIQRLLGLHMVQLLTGDIWVVSIPNEGDVQASLAAPADTPPNVD